MSTALILLALVLLFLLVEALFLARLRRALPVRILVLGTRGKTTVTEYLAVVLRSSGYRTLAKTTGTRPRVMLPDGSHESLRRVGRARVHEQWRIMRRAQRLGCNAIVLECMSVSPELQRLESFVLRPTLAVLTNILDDHQEVFGDVEAWRIKEFASSLPRKTVLVSGEERHADAITCAAARLKSSVPPPPTHPETFAETLPEAMIPSNLLLALSVAEQLGVPADDARAAILALPQTQPYRELPIADQGPALRLLNAFAVNDVESASGFMEAWRQRISDWERTVILFNTRSDRPLRSLQFARWCVTLKDVESIILLGTHVPRTRREFHRLGVAREGVVSWTRDQRARPLEALRPFAAPGTVCVGVGNTAGDGLRLLEAAGML